MTIVYLLRHGALAGDNRERFIGQTDLPLSPQGILQAEAMALALRDKGIATIHCSEPTRSRQTAKISGRAIGIEPSCRLLGRPVQNMFRLGQDYGCVNILELDRRNVRLRLLNGRSEYLDSDRRR